MLLPVFQHLPDHLGAQALPALVLHEVAFADEELLPIDAGREVPGLPAAVDEVAVDEAVVHGPADAVGRLP